ncbi:MAG: hypothetical protein HFJ09_01525 [Lachnospiraceae bacterium]|nr:hypothetical protein [Lachnospiraceae bacterium]
MEKLPEQVKVYNLSVEDCHNYYVSEKGVLVHNECTGDNTVNIESGNLFNRQKILNGLKNAEVEYKKCNNRRNGALYETV